MKMENRLRNCGVRAVHRVTGDDPAEIVRGISQFRMKDGGPAFMNDGRDVMLWCLGAYLESRGWTVRICIDKPELPWTGIISIDGDPGHVFAIVDGRICDDARCVLDGANIDFIFVPPPKSGASRAHGDA